jgi:hypothetical protein
MKMKLRIGLAIVMALVIALTVGGVAFAKDGGDDRVEHKIDLAPTDAGKDIGATGEAKVRIRDSRGLQKFEVALFSQLANGQTFKVYVTNSASPEERFLAGELTVQLGVGEVELTNEDGATLPQGVEPVTEIQTVVVENSEGEAVLQGSF